MVVISTDTHVRNRYTAVLCRRRKQKEWPFAIIIAAFDVTKTAGQEHTQHTRARARTHACTLTDGPIYCVSTAFRYSLCKGECGREGCDISPCVAHRVLLTRVLMVM